MYKYKYNHMRLRFCMRGGLIIVYAHAKFQLWRWGDHEDIVFLGGCGAAGRVGVEVPEKSKGCLGTVVLQIPEAHSGLNNNNVVWGPEPSIDFLVSVGP